MSYIFLKQMGPYQASLFSTEDTYTAMVQRIRSQYTLSPEECWLDQREPPFILFSTRPTMSAVRITVPLRAWTALR